MKHRLLKSGSPGLLTVWTDGKKETDEIVSEWTESLKTLTANTRNALVELKATADANGYTGVSAQLQADIDQLDAIDKEIERLLRKRRTATSPKVTRSDLQELIDTREAIVVKYHLTPAETDGFETIAQKVEAEVARAHARGQSDADVSVYEMQWSPPLKAWLPSMHRSMRSMTRSTL